MHNAEHAIASAIDGLVALAIRGGPRDISLTAAATLATLERGGPARLTDLAEIEGVAQPSMSTLVTGLERAGLAERRPSPDDGRVVLVALTAAGGDYLAARRLARAERLAGLIRMLPADQAAALAAAIPAMTNLRDLQARRRAAGAVGRAEQELDRVGGQHPPGEVSAAPLDQRGRGPRLALDLAGDEAVDGVAGVVVAELLRR